MSRTLWRGTIRRFAGVIALALVLPILPIGMQAAGARTPAADFGLTFNGTTQYATAGSETDGTYSNLGASQFTLEGWIRRTGAGATASTGVGGLEGANVAVPLITKGRGEGDASNLDMNYFLGIHGTTGRLVADFEDNDTVNTPTDNNHPVNLTGSTGTVIPTGVWTHVAATYDGSQWRLYVNGNLDVTKTETGSTTPRFDSIQRFAIGSAQDSGGNASGFFAGSMDEVRVWNIARTQTQIRSTMNDEVTGAPNLIGRWGLNQGSGATATNSGIAGSNANLALVASPTWGNGSDFGNRALAFNGSTQYLRTATTTTSSALQAANFTIETWFRRTATGVTTNTGSGADTLGFAVPLVAKGRAQSENVLNDINYFLGIDTKNTPTTADDTMAADFEGLLSAGNSPNQAITGTSPVPLNSWQHAAITYNGSVFKLYLNGNEEASRPTSVTASNQSTVVTTLGTAFDGTGAAAGFFAGQLDETRIWNVARSQAQIQASMGYELTSGAGLIGRWGMNEGTGTSSTADSVGTNTGTMVATPTWITPGFPSTQNSAPVISGATIDQASPGTDDNLSVSVSSSDANGDAVANLYQWRKNGVDITGATNATLNLATAGNGDAGDQISVRVTGHDGFSLSTAVTSSAVTIVNPNTAPTADVSLNDGAPRTNDTITATAVGSDGQNDPLTYTFVWKVEGLTQQTTSNVASTTDTFDLSTSNHGNRGEQVTVTVTANDGSLTSTPTASSTASAIVENTPPAVDSVTIDQTSPGTNDVLSATITSSDADGDSRTYTYQWLKTGNPISGETNAALDLGVAGNGSSGDQLSLRVRANDGTDDSPLVTSSGVTIGNTGPVVDSVTIDQSSPVTDDVLSVTVDASDGDSDALTFDYQWTKNGVDLSGETGATLDLDDSGNGDRGDEIAVRVTASDGGSSSNAVTSDAVTVANSAPAVTQLTMTPDVAGKESTVVATVSGSDADGDAVLFGYEWKVNDEVVQTTPVGANLQDSLDLSTLDGIDFGDFIIVTVTPSDPTDVGAPRNDAIVVYNRLPIVDSVAISPEGPVSRSATLTADVTAHDPDGDAVTFEFYEWYSNGSVIPGETAPTLDLSKPGIGEPGDEISFSVAATDGSGSYQGATSASVTVKNFLPTATVSLSDHSPGTNDILTATATGDDLDGDPVTFFYVWRVNGNFVRNTLTSQLTDTFDLSEAGNGDNGDTVTVTVYPGDDINQGDAATDTAIVGNQAPVVESVAISPSTLRTLTVATTTVTGHDDDGDAFTYDYQWTKNGVDIDGATGETLHLADTGNGDRGDQIAVRVTATDGSATSAPVTSATKIVADSPSIVSFVFTPPAHIYTNDVLNFPAGFGDPDGDPTPNITYEWRVDGVAVQSTTSLANTPAADFDLSESGHGDSGQTVALYYAVNASPMSASPVVSGVVENSAPSVDGATIDPTSPRTNDTLSVLVSSTDPDGDALTYDYQWTKNGSDLVGETGDDLDLSVLGNGDKGDEISVGLTPSDGTDQGPAFATDPVMIANTTPTATVSLSDAGPGTDDTLTATASRSDADGDGVLLTYEWKVDGTTRQVTSGTASLSDSFDLSASGDGDNGQTVTVTVTPNDGEEDGAPAVDTATVGNAAPVITSANIDEAAPRTNDTIHVSVVASDDDGDTVTYTYQWTNDGVNIVGQTGPSLDLSLPGNGGNNHVMAVKVTAHDGNGGTSAEVTALGVTIANTPPSATVSLNTATPGTNQTLTATATKSDADAEAITLTYVWKVNGVTKQTTTKTSLTDTFDLSVSGNGGEGDTISVIVTPDDSDALGSLVSASATVGNTAPVVNSIAIDQASALTNDTLTTPVSTSDPDGDSVAVTYQWLKNGNPIVGQTGSSLDLSLANNGTRGDIIRVRATADDGQTTGTLLSATVTIGNSAPTATVSLAPTSPFTNDTLTATATKADADANAVTLTYVWKVNGATVKTTAGSNALTDTLDLSQPGNGDPGQQVTVTVTPNDGTDSGAPVISNTATVSTVNGTPTASGSNFAITKDAGRSITLKATDPEGDTLTYAIVTSPAHGTLSAGTGGTRTFTPAAGYSGADSFTFRVSDGSTNSGLATVNLTVAAKYKITITDSAFSPIASKPVQGGTVRFVNSGTAARTITDTSGMGLFGASINPGSEYAFRFTAAGKYEYSCSCSGSTGRIAIPVKILPAAGGTGVIRTVTWAVEDPAAGYVFDIQIKRPGIPGWTNWRTGVTTLSDAFTPDAGNGTYKFKARLRNTANNTHSLYSAAKAVSVS